MVADGCNDYLIELTAEGRRKMEQGYQPTYRHME
jgi:hypothetical protein